MFDLYGLGTQNELRTAFKALGAAGPGSARLRKELPPASRAFDHLLRWGVVREGAPGTFYLYQPPPAPNRWAIKALFWLVLIIVPVLLIQVCPGSP